MAKRSKALQQTVDKINEILKNDYVVINDTDRCIMRASSTCLEGMAYKQGLADALEILLRCHDCYRGFSYNNVSIVDGVTTITKKDDRKYY